MGTAWVEEDRCYVQLSTEDYRVTVGLSLPRLERLLAVLEECREALQAQADDAARAALRQRG